MKFIIKILLIIVSLLILFPIFLVIISSFLPFETLMRIYGQSEKVNITDIFNSRLTLIHFLGLFTPSSPFVQAFNNSVGISFFIVLGNTILSILTAYVFAKIKFKGSDIIFNILILIMLLPVLVKLVPNFIIIQKLGLGGKTASVVIPGIFNPFGVFILKQYMQYIPDDYIHSARINGATYANSLFHVVIPMSKSGILCILAFNLIESWSMIEQPLVLLNDERIYPLSIYLFNVRERDMGIGFAASVLFMLPVLVVFFLGRKHIMRGIQLSGFR